MSIQYDDTYTDSVSPDGILVGGQHFCPLCFRQLTHNSMPGKGETYRHCSSCGWWDTEELIKFMMLDEGGV